MKATITNCSGDSWKMIIINDCATASYYEEKKYSNYKQTDFSNSTVTIENDVIPVTLER